MRTKTANLVHLFDAADGWMAVLIPEEKAGGRFLFPKQEPSQQVGFGFFGGPLIEVPGEKTSSSESVGKQIIDGIEYEGTRITTTVKDQPSTIGIEKRWMASALGLMSLKSSVPGMEIRAKIRNLERHDPDPTLFQIPPDHEIRDLKD